MWVRRWKREGERGGREPAIRWPARRRSLGPLPDGGPKARLVRPGAAALLRLQLAKEGTGPNTKPAQWAGSRIREMDGFG